jgi:hypothetical protein
VVHDGNRIGNGVVIVTLCVAFYSYVREATELTNIGGFNLHITDLLFALIIFWSLFGLKNWRSHSASETMAVVLSGMLFLSFFRGVIDVGTAAGVAFRMYAVFAALIVFAFFWGRKLAYEWIFAKIVWLGWAIVFLGIARHVLGLRAFVQNLDPIEEPRIFNSAAALMLGQAALVALHGSLMQSSARRSWAACCFVVFFATVILSDQRTAMFATIAGLLTILTFVPRERNTAVLCTGLLACAAGVGIVGIAFFSAGQLTEYLPRSLQMIVLQEGSFGWRLDQWQTYVQQWVDARFFDQLIGQPFGVTLVIARGFSTLTHVDSLALPAHNGYLQLLVNVGAIGLLIFLLMLVFAFTEAILVLKGNQRRSPLVVLGLAILISQIVFSFSYSLDGEQGLLLAIAVQIIAVARQAVGGGRVVPPRSAPVPMALYSEHGHPFARGD